MDSHRRLKLSCMEDVERALGNVQAVWKFLMPGYLPQSLS